MDFKSLNEVYDFLEANTKKAKRQWELTADFKRFADASEDECIKNKVKWEMFAFDYGLVDGGVVPMFENSREDGVSIFSYPSYSDFNDETYEYLKNRADEAKSDFLVARYNQILWNSPKKHLQQCKNCIDAYLRILDKLNCIKEEKSGGWDCLDIFRNTFSLSLKSKYKVDEHKVILKEWLFNSRKFNRELIIYLVQFMIDLPQLKIEDFSNILELIKKIGQERAKKKKPDYYYTKELYKTGLRLAKRLGTDLKIWNEKIGDSIVKAAANRLNEEGKMMSLLMFEEAIPYYKLSGNVKKIKSTETAYFGAKKELKLTEISLPAPFEFQELINEYLDKKTNAVLSMDTEQIFGYLLNGNTIFPNMTQLKEMAKHQRKPLEFINVIKFDTNKNASKAKKGKEKEGLYESYRLYIRIFVLEHLRRIFVDGNIKNKVHYDGLMAFIVKHSWLAQNLSQTDSAGNKTEYNWISVIAPSLYEYFIQTEAIIRSGHLHSNYIMPIDSLTLKFEGALRDFASLVGVTTTISGKRDILREKYIEELLEEPIIKNYFNEDDILFFNYLFVAKEGMNLRNNIAHSFFKYHNYSFQIIHLLICAFLRLGKYKVNIH